LSWHVQGTGKVLQSSALNKGGQTQAMVLGKGMVQYNWVLVVGTSIYTKVIFNQNICNIL